MAAPESHHRRKTVVAERPLAWFVPQQGALEGRVFRIGSGSSIGAATEAQIRLEGYADVEPIHAYVRWSVVWFLVNQDSARTRVGDHEVAPQETCQLTDGDVVEIGAVRLVFRSLTW